MSYGAQIGGLVAWSGTQAEVQSESISQRATADEGTRINHKTLVIAL